jgi:hypothetical protein
MKNLKENLQSVIGNEDLKQTKVNGKRFMKSLLFICILLMITAMSSCYWGREGGGRGRGEHEHHEVIIEHHDDGHHDDRH